MDRRQLDTDSDQPLHRRDDPRRVRMPDVARHAPSPTMARPMPRRMARPLARRGFSFAEILFAVMILGIGFIMLAAIFPVAIKQTAQTGEESVAAAIAREATSTLTSLNNSNLMPPTIPQGFPA